MNTITNSNNGFNNVRWMKLRSARDYSGIGIKKLKLLAATGVLKGFKDPDNKRHDWVFDRESIDQYREAQEQRANGNDCFIKNMAKEILEGSK